MLKISNLFFLALLALSVKISAQTANPKIKSFKFGTVALEDFNTKITGADSAAAAIKLFDIGRGSFEISPKSGQFVYVFQRHVRYKVVNKKAYDLANVEIGLYNNSSNSYLEKIQSVHGATYNLVDGKIVTSKMNSDAKFSSRVDKNHIAQKFTLPNIKEGSIIEYNYSTVSDFIYTLDDWYFQDSYPTKYSAYTLTIPQYLKYKISAGGYIDIVQLKNQEIQESYHVPSGNTSSSGNITAAAVRTAYYAEDIPAIKSESYITTLRDYISRIGHELTAVDFPGSGYKDYSSTWPSIIKELKEDERFGQFINRDNYNKGFLAGIIKSEKDPVIIMNLIFDYIKKTVKWDGKYSYYSDANGQRSIIEKKSGNSAEISFCLLTLLNNAGLKSLPVLLSTRSNGRHPGYPLLTQFNNVIVETTIGEKKYLLDATDNDNLADLISYQNLNHGGLRVDLVNSTAEWISIENNTLNRSSTMYNLTLGTDNKFTGNLYLASTDYEGLSRRSAYKSATNQAEYLKSYKNNKPGLEILDYKIEHLDKPEEALSETITISIEDNVEDAGNLIYFTPLFYDRKKENPFNLEDRKFPVDFAYPFEENTRTIIEFPANYQLDKLPKNEAFALSDNKGGFSILYSSEGNKLAVKTKISINKSVFTAEDYFDLKELYKNIVRKEAEQIVFKKP
jgi:hypothetical protein